MQKIIKDKFYSIKDSLLSRVPFLAILITACILAFVLLYKNVNIVKINNNGKEYTVRTVSSDINYALNLAGLSGKEYKVLNVNKNGRVTNLSVSKTFPVYINIGVKVKKVDAVKSTVGEILDFAGISCSELDSVEPAVDTVITDTVFIDVTQLELSDEDEFSAPAEEIIPEEELQVSSVDAEPIIVNYVTPDSSHIYTACLTKTGGVYRNPYTGLRETYYSQRVLPGGGLKIPGRHVNSEGFVCDEEGYICVASNDFAKGTVVETSRGIGKVYDCGCANGTLDLYVNW